MARGFSSGDIYTSMENLPSASGVTRSPFTLSVASGNVSPATVTVSLATIMSPPGDVTSSSSPGVGAIGVGDGTVVAARGPGNGAGVGSSGGGSVAVGVVAKQVTVGEGAGVAVGLGEAVGWRGAVGWGGVVVVRATGVRVSRSGRGPGMWSMYTIGPLSRTVEDGAITLQAIAGHDPNDAYTWDVPVPDYRAALDGDLSGIRVGVVKELLYSDVVEPEIREAVSQSANSLAKLGAQVEEVSIPMTSYANTISTVLRVEAPTNYRELIRDRLQEIEHDNRIAYLTWSLIPAMAYYKALKLRALLRQQVLAALNNADVLLMPTMGIAAPKIEPDPAIDSKENSNRNRAGLTTSFSLASSPALSICFGFTKENLPIVPQLCGKPV